MRDQQRQLERLVEAEPTDLLRGGLGDEQVAALERPAEDMRAWPGGSGDWAVRLARAGARVVGLDFSGAQLGQARSFVLIRDDSICEAIRDDSICEALDRGSDLSEQDVLDFA